MKSKTIARLAGAPVALLALLAATPSAGAATLQTPVAVVGTTSAGTAPNIVLGAGVNFGWSTSVGWAASDLAQLAANNIHNVRQDFRWDLTEQSKGVYSWGRLDTIMTTRQPLRTLTSCLS